MHNSNSDSNASIRIPDYRNAGKMSDASPLPLRPQQLSIQIGTSFSFALFVLFIRVV
jgi:hypothetical protein